MKIYSILAACVYVVVTSVTYAKSPATFPDWIKKEKTKSCSVFLSELPSASSNDLSNVKQNFEKNGSAYIIKDGAGEKVLAVDFNNTRHKGGFRLPSKVLKVVWSRIIACKNLSPNIPKGYLGGMKIALCIFSGPTTLTSLVSPESVSSISIDAFMSCTAFGVGLADTAASSPLPPVAVAKAVLLMADAESCISSVAKLGKRLVVLRSEIKAEEARREEEAKRRRRAKKPNASEARSLDREPRRYNERFGNSSGETSKEEPAPGDEVMISIPLRQGNMY